MGELDTYAMRKYGALDWGEFPRIVRIIIRPKAGEKADVHRVPPANCAFGPRWVAPCDMGGSSYGIDA